MELKEKIFKENNKKYWKKVSKEIIENKEIPQLLNLFFSENYRTSQRASAYFMTIIDKDYQLLLPHLDKLLNCLVDNPTETQKRNIIRFLQFIDIPEKECGKVYTICSDYLSHIEEATAVKAFSMKVAYNISEKYPELKPELAELIQFNLDQNPTSGVRNRGQKILKFLLKE